jgi:hypothetical protein
MSSKRLHFQFPILGFAGDFAEAVEHFMVRDHAVFQIIDIQRECDEKLRDIAPTNHPELEAPKLRVSWLRQKLFELELKNSQLLFVVVVNIKLTDEVALIKTLSHTCAFYQIVDARKDPLFAEGIIFPELPKLSVNNESQLSQLLPSTLLTERWTL